MQYNGCKWLGGTLRVELAKPDFKQRLAEDAAKDLSCEPSAALKTSESPQQTADISDAAQRSVPIHLPSRDGRKVIHL